MNASNTSSPSQPDSQLTRRSFLKTTSGAVVAGSLVGGLALDRGVFAAGDDTLKIALVGCGGRGSGAANQALKTPGNTRLVALADVRPEQLQKGLAALTAQHPDKIDVPPERQF